MADDRHKLLLSVFQKPLVGDVAHHDHHPPEAFPGVQNWRESTVNELSSQTQIVANHLWPAVVPGARHLKEIELQNPLDLPRGQHLPGGRQAEQLLGGGIDDRHLGFLIGQDNPVDHRFDHQLHPPARFVLGSTQGLDRIGGLVCQRIEELSVLGRIGVPLPREEREGADRYSLGKQRNGELAEEWLASLALGDNRAGDPGNHPLFRQEES